MPQMFPMSWLFIYLYVLVGFFLVSVMVSYLFECKVVLSVEFSEVNLDSWMW